RRQKQERMYNDWMLEKKHLETKLDKSEENVRSLQRTIEQLRSTESSMQGKEAKIHQAFHDERDRHRQQEEALQKHIAELNVEIAHKKGTIEQKISECNDYKERLRQSNNTVKSL